MAAFGQVKWIKITTSMFEDEKIDYIESLPEGDTILIIWIKLLTQAGKNNVDGFIFLTSKIPFTVETLAHKFRRPLNTVKLALATLEKLEMIEFDDNGFLKICNWEKHQNIDGLDKIREQNRLRQQAYRDKQKQLATSLDTVTLRVTQGNAPEEEEEEEKEEDKNRKKAVNLLPAFNNILSAYKDKLKVLPQPIKITGKRKTHIYARLKEYGEDKVIEMIDVVSKSDFLLGNIQTTNGKAPFKADIDWIFNPNNFVKIIEGKYNNKQNNGPLGAVHAEDNNLIGGSRPSSIINAGLGNDDKDWYND